MFLSSYYGLKGQGDARATGLDSPIPTQPTENRHALVATHLMKLRGTCRDGQPVSEPAATISAQGTHIAEVRALLVKYYGTDQDPRLDEPMHTLTTKDRIGVVTVLSEDYVIVDIGMRMLTARELFRAQGFPDSYIINRGRDPQTGKTHQAKKKGAGENVRELRFAAARHSSRTSPVPTAAHGSSRVVILGAGPCARPLFP